MAHESPTCSDLAHHLLACAVVVLWFGPPYHGANDELKEMLPASFRLAEADDQDWLAS